MIAPSIVNSVAIVSNRNKIFNELNIIV